LVAQLGRALSWYGKDRWFKSSPRLLNNLSSHVKRLTAEWMQHNIVIKNDSYRFNIQHDLSIKWSLYVKTLVLELCQDVLGRTVDVKIDDNLISLVFRE
jgi:hypothetical protein